MIDGLRIKLKGYLIQMSLKLKYKGPKIVILVDIVIYVTDLVMQVY